MRVLEARNVHDAFPRALMLLKREGVRRESRNGPVLQMPCPVVTVYERPYERVIFYPERDANPFFHLYEALWMLAGRNDVAGPVRYAKQMAAYTDNGKTFHGAYGHRWRQHFSTEEIVDTGIGSMSMYQGLDQLPEIAAALLENHEDRRQVLSMWDAEADLGRTGKDVPCNLTATFQMSPAGSLELTVFNRSNDIIWGCYGANAVHFSMLHEYMANWIGVPQGVYRQISVNWHAYLDTFQKVEGLIQEPLYSQQYEYYQPYLDKGKIRPTPPMTGNVETIDREIEVILAAADTDFKDARGASGLSEWAQVAYAMMYAHYVYRTSPAPAKFSAAKEALSYANYDWLIAGTEWLDRRQKSWEAKQ